MNKWKKAMAVVAAGTMLGTSLVVSPYAFACHIFPSINQAEYIHKPNLLLQYFLNCV